MKKIKWTDNSDCIGKIVGNSSVISLDNLCGAEDLNGQNHFLLSLVQDFPVKFPV